MPPFSTAGNFGVLAAIFDKNGEAVASSGIIPVTITTEMAAAGGKNTATSSAGRTSAETADAFCVTSAAPVAKNNINVDDTYQSKKFTIVSQTREMATDKIMEFSETIDGRNVGFVLMDTWDYHWCMTTTNRINSFVPRINKVLAAMRQLGVRIYWSPAEMSESHAGQPQRERVVAKKYGRQVHSHRYNSSASPSKIESQMHHHSTGHRLDPNFEAPKCFATEVSGCACGPYARQCLWHHGSRRINPGCPPQPLLFQSNFFFHKLKNIFLIHICFFKKKLLAEFATM